MNKPDILTKDLIKTIYDSIFRQNTKQAGFYYLNLEDKLNSKVFRQLMVDLKNALSILCNQHLKKELHYQSLGRFNHQDASKPHRDTAGDHSFLILGYEPTMVESKAFITDYSKYIEHERIPLETFFGENKETNLVEDISSLTDYKTEMKPFNKNHYRILIANNSRSYAETTFGVFHSAEIPEKVDNQDRLLNYMMLKLSDLNSKEQYTLQDVQEFLNTDKVNR
jgi:hypothetical protein